MPTVYEIDLTAGVQPGPSGAWAEYQWYRWDGAPADESEIWMSLASIQAIHIQADFDAYGGAGDIMALDKVSLNAPPGAPLP
jgi:hypothetical protein